MQAVVPGLEVVPLAINNKDGARNVDIICYDAGGAARIGDFFGSVVFAWKFIRYIENICFFGVFVLYML
jgi:hypothetical protein